MAASEEVSIVDLTPADVEPCLLLSDEAGWNQTADDWRVFLRDGRTFGVRAADGTVVATAAALAYDAFGFVSMVLVTPAWRRRGIASALLDQCVAHLKSRGVTPVLDATPAGALVYRKQGFVDMFGLDRWQRPAAPQPASDVAHAASPGADDRALMHVLDREATGADRRFLLDDFAGRDGSRTLLSDDRSGFAIVRRGHRALQVGPVVASSAREALRLLGAILDAAADAIFIDVPSVWKDVAEWLRQRGFTLQRSFTRMGHGRGAPFGRPERLFAAAGPEFG